MGTTGSIISRRRLIGMGALAGLATVIRPLRAQSQMICNPDRPGTPAAALAALIAGNADWAAGTQTHPGEDPARRACVASNLQTPFAAILACSDSRVAPELVFDQGLGDLFVARVAGNTARGKLVESLLYGTHELGTELLFVMGHSSCGAVSTAVASYPKHDIEFVDLIFPAVKLARKIVRRNGGDPEDPLQVIPVATDQNVILVVKRLRKEFRDRVRQGKLLVAGGRYDLSTQQITMLIQ